MARASVACRLLRYARRSASAGGSCCGRGQGAGTWDEKRWGRGQWSAADPSRGAIPAAAVQAAGQQADGLILRVRQLVDGYDSIECGTRHQIDLFDHQILGAGHYYQQGHGLRRLTRFEQRSQIGNQTTTRFEVADGNSLWTYREIPGEIKLTHVDLQRVFQAWDQARHAMPAVAAREPEISGLPKLLQGISDDFRFERVVGGQLGDRPVWIVEGSWKPEKLIAAVPDQKANIEAGRPLDLKRLPAQLPERIVLEVGQADLFPYRLDYLRARSNSASGGPRLRAGEGRGEAAGYRPIVSIDWFDVHLNRPIDPQKFVYQPTGVQQVDTTEAFLKTLNLAPAERK